jgi:4-amino-4-deoxy-L-arabinose transferase-like glycosyltransferase
MPALTRLPPERPPEAGGRSGIGTLSRSARSVKKGGLGPTLILPRLRGREWEGGWGGEGSGIRPYALLCLLCLILYAPGLAAIPPLDRDEARFAQATRQMLETGDFVRIRFQDEARNKKPIGIYWLQAAAVAAFSSPERAAIWPYRLPSAVAATAAVLLTFGFGAGLFGSPPAGFIAATLTASALGVIVEAHLAKTDAALLAAIVAAQGALGLVYIGARTGRSVGRSLPVLFWVAEAAAILLKGPPGPVLALLTAVCLSIADREIRWIKALRPILGVLIIAVIVAPWLIAVQAATAGHFVLDSLAHDLVPKLVGAQESHGAPPGYYLAVVIAGFWPGSIFIVPALIWGWRQRRAAAARFLLAWLGPAWIFFEFVPTKLPHYVLPLYPALALLAGGALAKGLTTPLIGPARLADGAIRAIWAAVTIVLGGALIALPLWFNGAVSPAVVVAVPMMLGLSFLLLFDHRQPLRIMGLVAAASAAFVLPAALVVVPGLDPLWPSRSAAAALARQRPSPGEVILAVGYNEPSLVFLLGTRTRLVTAEPSDDQLAGAGMALVNDRHDAEFMRSITPRGLTARALDRVEGLDYSAGGGKLVLTLYRLEPG